MKTYTARIKSGGGSTIPFCGTVPSDGTIIFLQWGTDSCGRGKIPQTGQPITIGFQRGGNYGFRTAEPIRVGMFPLEVFRPSARTLEIKQIECAGVGGQMGVPIAPGYDSEDKSELKVGETLAIYPAPYYGSWNTPLLEIVSEYDPDAAAKSITMT